MSFVIESGAKNSNKLEIDKTNRARIRGIEKREKEHATESGDSYNLNTGTVNLTSANASAVMYFKNNEDDNYIINSFIYSLGASTGGSGVATVDVYFNPTGGTIISGASDVDINVNQNLGSANTLTALVYKGAEGNTQTGGALGVSSLVSTSNRAVVALGEILVPKGSSIAVVITPPTGNTSMDTQVAISGYLSTKEVTGE